MFNLLQNSDFAVMEWLDKVLKKSGFSKELNIFNPGNFSAIL